MTLLICIIIKLLAIAFVIGLALYNYEQVKLLIYKHVDIELHVPAIRTYASIITILTAIASLIIALQ